MSEIDELWKKFWNELFKLGKERGAQLFEDYPLEDMVALYTETYPALRASYDALAAENARLREALDWVQSLLEVKPDSPNLALDAISSTLKADDFTVGTCPECGARAYHWGNMIAECHAGGCSRGKDATPIMRQCGGAS